jgi:hypothetical protein
LAVVTAVVCVATQQNGRGATAVAGILGPTMIGIYFLYFQTTNAKFAVGQISRRF